MLSRRDLVKSAGVLGAIGVLTSCSTLVSENAPSDREVLIVGAGIAGMAAAAQLVKAGYSVRVLEARNRIGGRIHTSTKWAELPIDLGASWIHETQGNPLTELAEAASARTVTTNYDSVATFETGRGEISTDDSSAYTRMSTAVQEALGEGGDAETESSVRALTEDSLGFDELSPEDQRLLNHFVVSMADTDFAGDSDELSSWYWDDMSGYAGFDAVLPDGYIALVEHLATGVTVQLGEKVTRIEHDSDGVRVRTSGGEYRGSRVIVTVPLGVLKTDAVKFAPSLPEEKRIAIDALGMGTGTLSKVFLKFPEVFWSDVDWIEYVASVPDRGRFHQWLNVSRIADGAPVLLGFLGGSYAHLAEQLTDAQIVDLAMSTLRDMYGTQVPDPVDWQIPRWSTDPYALGSYSFNRVGSIPAMRSILAESIANRVFFAGEATQEVQFATVHGAYLSGLRTADEVMVM